MKPSKQLVLAMVAHMHKSNPEGWVTIPADAASKARALCRDGLLRENNMLRDSDGSQFRCTPLGLLMAKDMSEIDDQAC